MVTYQLLVDYKDLLISAPPSKNSVPHIIRCLSAVSFPLAGNGRVTHSG